MSYQPYQPPKPAHGGSYDPFAPPSKDRDHLKLLAIFYYIMGGLNILGVCISTVYLGMGLMMFAVPSGDSEAAAVGFVLFIVGGMFFVLSLVTTILHFLTAQGLTMQNRYTLCFATACLTCLNVPLGTILGIFTIMVLNRPSVKALFGRPAY